MNLTYKIKENGYEIYNEEKLWITQYEPYIPNPSLTYEENALNQIEELTKVTEDEITLKDRVSTLEGELANVSYTLMMGGLM